MSEIINQEKIKNYRVTKFEKIALSKILMEYFQANDIDYEYGMIQPEVDFLYRVFEHGYIVGTVTSEEVNI